MYICMYICNCVCTHTHTYALNMHAATMNGNRAFVFQQLFYCCDKTPSSRQLMKKTFNWKHVHRFKRQFIFMIVITTASVEQQLRTYILVYRKQADNVGLGLSWVCETSVLTLVTYILQEDTSSNPSESLSLRKRHSNM